MWEQPTCLQILFFIQGQSTLMLEFHFIRDIIAKKQLHIRYISSKDQLVDLLTKELSRTQHQRLSKMITI